MPDKSRGTENARSAVVGKLDLAVQAQERGDHKTSLEIIYGLLTKAPNSSYLWTLKASSLKDLEKHDDAIEAANRAIDLKPLGEHIFGAWMTLGYIALDRGQFREAARCFSKMVENWEGFESYTILASAELQFDAQLADLHAEKALELNPDWNEAQNILAAAQTKLGKSVKP